MPKAPPRTNDLLAFMRERHRIYQRRTAGKPWPWTKDPILQAYSFCNVYRELDKVTQWVRKNIREPYYDHPHLWFMLCVARQINWPETLQELMEKGAWPEKCWDWEHARSVMLTRQRRGEKLYTGAYMLNAHGAAPTDPKDKAFFTCKLVLDSVWQARAEVGAAFMRGMREAHASLLPHHGWGGFTAYEVVCDARYTRYSVLSNWRADAVTWAFAGPGAKRGLNRLAGREVKAPLRDAQALAEMRAYHSALISRWSIAFKEDPMLEMREIEHCLCEFDKYERVRLGEGRPRAKYVYQGADRP